MSQGGFAPAKVNLFLHVGPLRDDLYHPVSSLMVFADIGDQLAVEPADRFSLQVTGRHADGVPGDDSNLVMKAARVLFAHAGVEAPALRLVLDKVLPVAAGLGGGSSDAAAAMKLLRDHLALDVDNAALERIGAAVGSDVPACVRATSVIGEGRGEVLRPGPALPRLAAVLLDPGVGSSTPAVYRAFDASSAPGSATTPALPASLDTVEDVVTVLAPTRNDLEAPAVGLQPRIGEALAALRQAPESLFARMSGSGSSCFALCADDASATALARRLPGAQACRLA